MRSRPKGDSHGKQPVDPQNTTAGPTRDIADEYLTPAIDVILPDLERFVHFDMPEQVSKGRTEWSAQLEEALPATGVGAPAVLELLRDVVIPNGSPPLGALVFQVGSTLCLPQYPLPRL